MRNVSLSKLVALATLTLLGAVHCSSAPVSPEDGAEEDGAIDSTSQALLTHCWAQIERPSPTAQYLPIGVALTLRTNPTQICPMGVSSERLSYRFYVEGPSGKISPQGATGWSSTRLVPFDTSTLTAGRYRIYVYSLPTSMVAAWQANDATARSTAVRSGYTYVDLGVAGWRTTGWGACSVTCGGGTQTRSVTCGDAGGHTYGDSYCDAGSKPAASQACNPQACSTCAHSECSTGTNLVASCSSCATTVCAGDSFCCDIEWDTTCRAEAESMCGSLCPP